ncbi:MAG: hypothetical protein KDB14_35205 [Planctomycetales bacterium]|nr:hypothetical protein [Planctomycetales bacterium]
MTHIIEVDETIYNQLEGRDKPALVAGSTCDYQIGDILVVQQKGSRTEHAYRIDDIMEIEVYGNDVRLIYLDEPINHY